MADLSRIAAQEIQEIEYRHFQEINAHLEKETALTNAVIERTNWLRMLTMGEMKLEYVQVLEDGQLRYNAPSDVTTIIEPLVEPVPVETCIEPPPVEAPESPEAPEAPHGKASNGKKTAIDLAATHAS